MKTYRGQIYSTLSFGLGLLLATVLPCKWVLIISLIATVFLAWSICRR
ncbi:MAG: hypothetical protein IJ903_01865 [Ruminococcus sp.]|nr:hypothetical protein [Ruminococcus sp.]